MLIYFLKHPLILLSLLFLVPIIGRAQLDADIKKQLDVMTAEWESSDKPGGIVGAIQDGKVVYQKSFGQANLEHQIPISSSSKFNVGALSKHFIAAAILHLEEQGKLSLKDPVKKYLPDFPNFRYTIQLNHLLQHTSGLHDYEVTKATCGWNYQDHFTHQNALNLIYKQEKLGTPPGTAFVFTHTNLTLLTEIITKVSGQSLNVFMQQHIFKPLQMTSTSFCDDPDCLVEGAAFSYQADGDNFKKSTIHQGNAGPTNLYTNADDLCRWFVHLDQSKKASVKKLDTPIQLKDGSTPNTTRGIYTLGQLFIHAERGLPKLWVYGRAGGYASSVFRFSGAKLTTFAITNSGEPYNGQFSMPLAYTILEKQFTKPASIDFTKVKTKKYSAKQLDAYTGYYWNNTTCYARHIYVKNDTLRYARIGQGRESTIIPIGKHRFQMIAGGDEAIFVEFEPKKSMQVYVGESDAIPHNPYTPQTYSAMDLKAFEGVYYCEALNAMYNFSVKEGELVATHPKAGEATLLPIQNDLFASDTWLFYGIQFLRHSDKTIKGFQINTPEAKGLVFKKMPKS